ncbi:unnamed protein product [Prunus armeniaca]|uniref:RNase H type-1 domain-containing protein n=1 Tax=Prunus armeniaca TaxID=36596 RepID=A0A6J5URJ8_PRUAR|nr:hypothetical protein GBA52_014152 [Prunus armeniaca]CAB4277855.1 unnamed protein product [Prunus armeniaca]
MAAVSEFESVQRLMVTPTLEPLSSLNVAEVWCPPRIGFVKINTDAAWKKESSMAAEGRAALRGLKKAIQNDFKVVVMESDSKGLVDGVGGKQGNKVWTIFTLLMEIRKLSSRFESREWSWPLWLGWVVELWRWKAGSIDRQSLVHVLVADGMSCPPSI